MNFSGFCPQCGANISQDRHSTGYAICECGWHDTSVEIKGFKALEKKVITAMVAVSLILVAVYAHLMNWGEYAVRAPILEIESITGMISADGYRELAQICTDLNKFDCAKSAYTDLYQRGDLEGLAELAHLNVRLNDTPTALADFAKYFAAKGQNGPSALEYGKLLEAAGQFDTAALYYEFSIKASPNELPVSATTAIVRMMMKQGRYAEARQRILDFQNSAGNASGYLNTELDQLNATLGNTAKGLGRHQGRPKIKKVRLEVG